MVTRDIRYLTIETFPEVVDSKLTLLLHWWVFNSNKSSIIDISAQTYA